MKQQIQQIPLTSALLCVLIGLLIGYWLNKPNKNKECGIDSCSRSCGNCPYCRRKPMLNNVTIPIPKPQQVALHKQETPVNEIKPVREGVGPKLKNPFEDIYRKGMNKLQRR